MKKLALLFIATILLFGCTTNYYLVTADVPTAIYSSRDSYDLITSIPQGNSFIVQTKINRSFVQYGRYKGYSIITNLNKQARLNRREYEDLEFINNQGYVSKSYTAALLRKTKVLSPGKSTSSSSPYSESGGKVNVRGYTRKNGTYVSPHTRSAPGRH